MGFKILCRWGIVLSVLSGACVEAQTVATRPTVHVQIYATHMSPRVVQKVGLEMARIFRSGGIAVEWMNCTGHEGHECWVTGQQDQFILHIVAKGRASADSVYGEAFLGADGKGKYADIFLDRIELAQRDYGVDQVLLMGAVAAHELGHLLLGPHAHSWSGIMSPLWGKESLRRLGEGNLLFSRDEANRMQARTREDEGTHRTFRAKAID